MLVQNEFVVQRFYTLKRFRGQKMFVPKKMFLVNKNSSLKKCWFKINLLSKKKILLQKDFWVQKKISIFILLSFSVSKVSFVFHKRWSPIKGCHPSEVIFHQRISSIIGPPPSLTSIKCCLWLKVVFHQRSSSINGLVLSKVVFHQRLSSFVFYYA